ncbi:FtsW/RodA/SpoVE family cell cycle protein [Sutcliffiella halmapala]|uniref:FtsW/RodA/SpoVE family cell cycle protein n=1 Tax=Sutcliffiella halmapala TaxID=79882 RepID=UPI001474DD35|nr:FtsW/RodA/SpoVE family cell cycle protein [Sutcliffiella halmapala]
MTEKASLSISQFLQRVKYQIRSKEAQIFVERELQHHIEQRKRECILEGYSEEEAERVTIEQMGNPTILGKEMHIIHKPKIDWFLIGVFALLIILGTVPFYFLSVEFSEMFFSKKVAFSLMAVVVVVMFMFYDYRKISNIWHWLFGIALLLSILIHFSNHTMNGVSYLNVGFFSINSWLVSVIYVISFVGMISKLHRETKKLWVFTLVMFLLPNYFFFTNPTLILTVFYSLTLLIVMAFSPIAKDQLKRMFLIKGVFSVSALLVLWINIRPHQYERLLGFIDPSSYPTTYGYFPIQLNLILNESKFFGKVTSSEVMKVLPTLDFDQDLIFVSLVAHLGWLFGIILLATFGLFLIRIVYISHQTSDPLGVMLVLASVSIIGLAAVWNIMMVFGLMPLTGTPLPFISYGGQFQLIYAGLIGLILSVYRRKDLVQMQSI